MKNFIKKNKKLVIIISLIALFLLLIITHIVRNSIILNKISDAERGLFGREYYMVVEREFENNYRVINDVYTKDGFKHFSSFTDKGLAYEELVSESADYINNTHNIYKFYTNQEYEYCNENTDELTQKVGYYNSDRFENYSFGKKLSLVLFSFISSDTVDGKDFYVIKYYPLFKRSDFTISKYTKEEGFRVSLVNLHPDKEFDQMLSEKRTISISDVSLNLIDTSDWVSKNPKVNNTCDSIFERID